MNVYKTPNLEARNQYECKYAEWIQIKSYSYYMYLHQNDVEKKKKTHVYLDS